jgi:hypothetical protein
VRIFYSHPMKRYGTATERREIAQIQARFGGSEVVDPSSHKDTGDTQRDLGYYLSLVDSCDCLVFTRLYGNVTEGVKPEVEHALSAGKPVYELRTGTFIPIDAPVKDLPLWQRLFLRARDAIGRGD